MEIRLGISEIRQIALALMATNKLKGNTKRYSLYDDTFIECDTKEAEKVLFQGFMKDLEYLSNHPGDLLAVIHAGSDIEKEKLERSQREYEN